MAVSAQSIEPAGEGSSPRHVAIIMDGNGRWAKLRGARRSVGHKRGAEAVKQAIEGAAKAGVEYLTLYAFSSENWNRPVEEVTDLMGLLKLYLSKEVKSLNKEGVRLRVIGSRERLSADIIKMIDKAENLTCNNTKLTLVIALSYGSREEILKATANLARKVQDGSLAIADIDERLFENELFTYDIPDPDLILRTSGEQRLSNFLLWQAAYSEFLFIDTLWPDFTKEHFIDAVQQYAKRDRRYGVRP
jgi:undecaprenyl diphosphate synthase